MTRGRPAGHRLNGDALRQMRDAHGWSQADLARHIHADQGIPCSRSHIANVESGKRLASARLVRALAVLCECEPADLITDP